MEQFEPVTPEQKRTEIGNKIQIDIALARALHEGVNPTDIIVKNAQIIGDFLDSHPEILDEYEKDKESALKKVEEIVYH